MEPQPISESGRVRISLVQLLARHRAMLLGYAFAICRDHHLAEDAVQDLSLAVAADPHRVPEGTEDAGRWLRAVLRNKTLELIRRSQARHRRLLSGELIDSLAETLDRADDEQADRHRSMRAAMAGCLQGLEGDARQVIEGRYCQGQTCEEIAGLVGRSVQAVYAILKRVRLALAGCVEQRLADLGKEAP